MKRKKLETVKDVIDRLGCSTVFLWKGKTLVQTFSSEGEETLLKEWGSFPVIEVGCCNGVHIHLLTTEELTIGQCRRLFGLTQSEVYDLTGIPMRTQQNWESKIRECPEYVRKLAVAEIIRQCK